MGESIRIWIYDHMEQALDMLDAEGIPYTKEDGHIIQIPEEYSESALDRIAYSEADFDVLDE